MGTFLCLDLTESEVNHLKYVLDHADQPKEIQGISKSFWTCNGDLKKKLTSQETELFPGTREALEDLTIRK